MNAAAVWNQIRKSSTPNPEQMRNKALTTIRFLFRNLGPAFPRPMSKWAYRLWFTPRRTAHSNFEKALLARADQRDHLDLDGRAIAVSAWGQGPVVLLIHGWEGRGAQLGSFVDPLVEAGFRVVTFDMPGHGHSQGKSTDVVEINRLIRLLEARENGFHAVIAHSFGSLTASFAIRQGLQLEKAVFLSGPANLNQIFNIYKSMLHLPQAVGESLAFLMERRFPQMGAELWNQMDTTQNAAGFGFPGLVFHDRHDPVTPWKEGAMIAARWPQAQLHVTEGLGHYKILRAPEVVNKAVAFIAEPTTTKGVSSQPQKSTADIA